MYKILLAIAIVQLIIIFTDGIFTLKKMAKLQKDNGELHLCVKMFFSFSMVIIAFLLWRNNFTIIRNYSFFIFIGMLFSALGDMIMAKVIKFKSRLIAAMASFSIAHIFYITAYIKAIIDLQLGFKFLLYILIGVYIITLVLFKKFIFNKNKSSILNKTALIYSLIIGTMTACAMNLVMNYGGGFIITLFGAVIFMLSDFLIGISEIKENGPKNQSIWVWFTYVIGQMCIIYTFIFL